MSNSSQSNFSSFFSNFYKIGSTRVTISRHLTTIFFSLNTTTSGACNVRGGKQRIFCLISFRPGRNFWHRENGRLRQMRNTCLIFFCHFDFRFYCSLPSQCLIWALKSGWILACFFKLCVYVSVAQSFVFRLNWFFFLLLLLQSHSRFFLFCCVFLLVTIFFTLQFRLTIDFRFSQVA